MFRSHLENIEFTLNTIKTAHVKNEGVRINEFLEVVGIEPWHAIATVIKPEENESLELFRERVIMFLPKDMAKELFYYMADEQVLRYAYLTKDCVYISDGKLLKAPRDIDACIEYRDDESFEDFKFRVFDHVKPY